MSLLRPSARVLATHARQPSIHFPDRSQGASYRVACPRPRPRLTRHHLAGPPSHSRAPHPCAPPDVISSSRFLQALPAKQADAGASIGSFSSYGKSDAVEGSTNADKPLLGPAGGQNSAGKGFGGSDEQGPQADYDEVNLPNWLMRSRYAPQEAELDAVMVSDPSTRPSRSR